MKNTFKPTYLYIKQHSITKKLYFGKTTRDDPTVYRGSGKYWRKHIDKHGRKFVETLWYCLFTEQESCTEFALLFSRQHSIVSSNDWMNLIEENGVTGGQPGAMITEETRKKLLGNKNGIGNKNFLGKHHSEETKRKIAESSTGKKGIPNKYALGFKHPTIKCPHCGKEGAVQLMKRYHFTNCKNLKDQTPA